MRRKIHGVFGIIESVNMQIDLDPIIFTTRARLPRRSFMRRLGYSARLKNLTRIITDSHEPFLPKCSSRFRITNYEHE